MTVLYWDKDPKVPGTERLFAGCWETPLALIKRHSYGHSLHLSYNPGFKLGPVHDKNNVTGYNKRKAEVQAAFQNFFDLCATSRPAMDTDTDQEWPKDFNGKNLPDPSEGGGYSF